MAVNLKRLVYFDSFMDPIANAIIGKRDDIDLVRLVYDTPDADNWAEISQAHGYQVQPQITHLPEPDEQIDAMTQRLNRVTRDTQGKTFVDVAARQGYGVKAAQMAGMKPLGLDPHDFFAKEMVRSLSSGGMRDRIDA